MFRGGPEDHQGDILCLSWFDTDYFEVLVDDAGLVAGEGLGQPVLLEPDLYDVVTTVIQVLGTYCVPGDVDGEHVQGQLADGVIEGGFWFVTSGFDSN